MASPDHIKQFFQLAKKFHQTGDLSKAELFYNKILAVQPDNLHANTSLELLGAQYHSLGLMAFKEKRLDSALELLNKAIDLQPQSVQFLVNLGNVYKALKTYELARECYEKALNIQPLTASVYSNLGLISHTQGHFSEAIDFYVKGLSISRRPEILTNLGNSYQELEQWSSAISSYQDAIQLEPQFYLAHFSLGNVYKKLQQFETAIGHYQTALKIHPNAAEVHNNLAMVFQKLEQVESALEHFESALRLMPDSVSILNNLGSIYFKVGKEENAVQCFNRAIELDSQSAESYYHLANLYYKTQDFDKAIECYQKTLALDPKVAEAAMNLGNVYLEKDNVDEALKCYKQAIREREDFFAAYNHLGDVLKEQGNLEAAIEQYKTAYSIEPNDGQLFRLALVLPPIYKSLDEMYWWRERLEQCINDLKERPLRIEDPLNDIASSNFYLSYQGLNDRDIQKDIAELYIKACPDLLFTSTELAKSHQAKIKIGFISCNLRKHSIGKFIAGNIAHLSSELFEVYLFRFKKSEDEIAQWLDTMVEQVIIVPDTLKELRQTIANYQMDIIFYPDIGMDAITYFLAFSRLAPLQCTTWGHGVTTGIPSIDYYISCRDMESERAQDYYTESLVLTDNLFPYYYRPPLPSPFRPRQDFGLPEEKHLYICPQSLFKIHPEFDEVLASILARDPLGEIIMLEGTQTYWLSILKARFKETIPDFDRIRFISRLSRHDFANVVALCEVMLDPYPIVGGNSTLDSLVTGTPIVTLPTLFSRGRVTYACYKKMGFLECVAKNKQNYIEIAVKLGTDKLYRKEVSQKILALCHVLYEDMSGVRELEQLLVKLYQGTLKV